MSKPKGGILKRLAVAPLDDLSDCLNRLADHGSGPATLGMVTVALIATWFLYVPAHELLHVAGCVVVGGEVSELELAPQYGGVILSQWFPFVVSGGDYAGRLSGFDTKGCDGIYLVTVFAPYLLTILIGVPLVRLCTMRRRPLLLGASVVLGLAPFYNVIGDYYEMGSVTVTRVATWIAGGGDTVAFVGIRSDDIFKLCGTLFTKPVELGLEGTWAIAVGAVLILLSFALGVVLAVLTYAAGRCVAVFVFRAKPSVDAR